MTEPKATNITWHAGDITREDREKVHGHRGATLWFTGLSGSGKSTVARQVEKLLIQRGCFAYVLDGDNVRYGLCRDLGFAPEERRENIRRIGEVARLFADAGGIAIAAFISPYRKDRDRVRAIMQQGDFLEVFVSAPLEVCEGRDPKGLYEKARAGGIPSFTGISAPYEEPEKPEITLNTADEDVDGCAQQVLDVLTERGILPK